MRYLDLFLSLKCAGDVLNITNPIQNPAKEISETMAIAARIKRIVLKEENKMKFNVLDLCAGNALTSVLAVHMLPVTFAVAVDMKPRNRPWERAKRFEYVTMDIYDQSISKFIEPTTIIISSHPCQHAVRVIDLYNKTEAKHLILIPCCINKQVLDKEMHPYTILNDKFDRYEKWAIKLADRCEGTVDVKRDKYCLSAKNIVITASK